MCICATFREEINADELTEKSRKTKSESKNENNANGTAAKVKSVSGLEHKQVKVVKGKGQPGSGLGGTSDDESMLQQLQKLNIRWRFMLVSCALHVYFRCNRVPVQSSFAPHYDGIIRACV